MQGQQSGVGFFPEVSFENGSTSNDAGLDQQMFWNNIGNSGQDLLPTFMVSSGDTDIRYVNGVVDHPGQSFNGWDQKTIHGWSDPIIASDESLLQSDIQQHISSNVLSAGNFDVTLQRNGVEDVHETLVMPNSGPHQDININSGLVEDDDDCQVLEGPPIHKPGSLRTQPIHFASSSSDPFGVSNGNRGYSIEDIVGGSSDGRRLSCKRKILEGSVEQGGSSSSSTSYVQHSDINPWHAIPARASSTDGSISAAPVVVGSHSFNLPEHHMNPGFGSSTRPMANESSSLLANSRTLESSRRNSRSRMSNTNTHQQGSLSNSMFSFESATGNINLSSRPLPRNSLAIRPPTSSVSNTNSEAPSVVVQLSSLHRNPQLQPVWNSPAGSRTGTGTGNSSNFQSVASFEPSNSVGVPRNIADHPMFTQHNAPSWGLASGNVNNPSNVASSFSQNAANTSAHPVHYPSRLSESVRRALLSTADAGSRGQNSNHSSLNPGASSSQGVSLSSGSRRPGRHSHSRQAMLLERHLGGALGTPSSVRALAAYNDGRTRLMSELQNALELVRRGEGLRLQDAMILNHPMFFGMMDIHDRHRDMRLDVDNMSYEELLALEERIGSVNTGLSEESIVKQLKLKKHANTKADEMETEPCCICREEYNDGEDIGTLDCGHDFHGECIKQWLMLKNLCPICKTTGLTK